MDSASRRAMFTAGGTAFKAVLIGTDGVPAQVEMSLAPAANAVVKLLGGEATFLGQWPSLGSVVMVQRAPARGTRVNAARLQPPFHKERVVGNILLVSMDASSRPRDLTLARYASFAAKAIAPFDVPEIAAVAGGGGAGAKTAAPPRGKRARRAVGRSSAALDYTPNTNTNTKYTCDTGQTRNKLLEHWVHLTNRSARYSRPDSYPQG